MLILERSQVVDILVDNNVEIVGLVVRCDVCLGEGLRHLALSLVLRITISMSAKSKGGREGGSEDKHNSVRR